MSEKTLGQVAYEAFGGMGSRADAYEDLEPTIREGWEDAALAVSNVVAQSCALRMRDRCSAICEYYIASPPTEENARGGYLNAAQGIRGRIDAIVI